MMTLDGLETFVAGCDSGSISETSRRRSLPKVVLSERLAKLERDLGVGAEPQGATIFIAYPQNRSASPKVRAWIKCLREAFGDPPYWDAPISDEVSAEPVRKASVRRID